MTTENGHPASVPVPARVRDVLLALAEGWTPSALVLGSIQQFRLNGTDLTKIAHEVRLEQDRLTATLGVTRFNARARELMPFSMDAQIGGTLSGGATFSGDMMLRVSQSADLRLEMGAWLVLDGDAPSLWIGRVEGAVRIRSSGNLIIERVESDGFRVGHSRHFCLSGEYTYYLVQYGDPDPTWHLVIDTARGVPDTEALSRDFLLLQFVLGRQLRIPALSGVTDDRRTTGSATGVGSRQHLQRRSEPPVPLDRDNDARVEESWAVLLFERVTAAWSARPQAVTAYLVAFESYLDAMTLHLDADYLRLQVALEAFSYWTLRYGNHDERMVVKDKGAWKQWVRSNAGTIRSLAVEGLEETLFSNVMGVYRLSSGRVVPSAFLAYDVTLTTEMMKELEERNVVVHQGLMAPDGYDADRDSRRVALVRTLLVALIARTVDYAGAINGWEVGNSGYPKVPDPWWKVNDDDRRMAQRTFVAEGPTAVQIQTDLAHSVEIATTAEASPRRDSDQR